MPTLELNAEPEQHALEADRAIKRDWLSRGVDRRNLPALVEEFCRTAHARSEDRHDLRALMVATISRFNNASRKDIDRCNSFYQQLLDLRIAMCDILLGAGRKLTEKVRRLHPLKRQILEASEKREEAIADYRQWKDDLPDELLLRHDPVRQRLAAAVEKGLRNPPTESNWRELFE
jgi:hypothetical protein